MRNVLVDLEVRQHLSQSSEHGAGKELPRGDDEDGGRLQVPDALSELVRLPSSHGGSEGA